MTALTVEQVAEWIFRQVYYRPDPTIGIVAQWKANGAGTKEVCTTFAAALIPLLRACEQSIDAECSACEYCAGNQDALRAELAKLTGEGKT